MRPKSFNPSVFVAAAASLLLLGSPIPAAAYVHVARGHHGSRHTDAAVFSFPYLTRARDAAIEWWFGRPRRAGQEYGAFDTEAMAWYQKWSVVRFVVGTGDEEAGLRRAVERMYLDVWAFNNHTGAIDIRLRTDEIPTLLKLIPTSLEKTLHILIPNLATAVLASAPRSAADLPAPRAMPTILSSGSASEASKFGVIEYETDNVFFQDYQPLSVIVRWMKLLESMFPLASMVNIGRSAEGRDILGLRLGMSSNKKVGAPRKTILITGGFHAREWISTTTVNYLAWSLISTYGKEGLVTDLLDHFDVVLIPVVNPDGYDYTWTYDRLWRKTRQVINFLDCRGIDLDHAFGYEWGSSKIQPCAENYGGKQAFEAVEAQALSAWAKNEVVQNNVEFLSFLDLHSYSQQVLYPFSFSCSQDPPNLENLEEVALGIAKAIRQSSGESYSVTSACEGVANHEARGSLPRIESGGGTAIDWFYHELKAKFSYQIKLRDTGVYGFLLPRSHIVPTGEEMFNALKLVGDFLLGNNGIERGAKMTSDGEAATATSGAERQEEAEWSELRRRRLKR